MAMSQQPLTKPKMRGLLQSYLRKVIFGAFLFSGCVAYAVKKNVFDVRRKAYADFYKNYDPEKEYQRMKKVGIFRGLDGYNN